MNKPQNDLPKILGDAQAEFMVGFAYGGCFGLIVATWIVILAF